MVVEAADGKTGLRLMTEQRPDLVLQDLLLPDMNGFDLVVQLRALPQGEKIPILAVTGFMAKADELRVAAAPFTEYLFKPLEPTLLVSTVKSHLSVGSEKLGLRRHVLVVDDDPAQQKLLATYLTHLGIEVATAAHGTDGLLKAREQRPDAIVSDVLMPGLDGFQFCAKVREDPELARIPIVLRSNKYDQPADKELAREVGAFALVPSDPEFRDAIDALFASLESTPLPISRDPDGLKSAHEERVSQQLDRQAMLSVQLARRCAAQSAQLSVLASMGDNFHHGKVDHRTLLTDVLAQYLNVMGFSCGAIYLVQPENDLELAAQIGFPDEIFKSLPTFFGFKGILQEATREGEPVSFSLSPQGETGFSRLLTDLRAQSLLITPLRFRNEPLGVIVLISDMLQPDPDWLPFSKALTYQIGQVVALGRAISRIQYLASHDPLTNLPNRTHLCERIQTSIANGNKAALFLLNLNRFQQINNSLGYRNGNMLLGQFARRLEETFASHAVVARLGADEFVVLSPDGPGNSVDQTARKILASLEPTFRLDGLPIGVRGRIGIALLPDHGIDPDTLLSCADMAQRAARRTGNDYLIYPAHVESYNADHLGLLADLRHAIEENQLRLHYQPKVSFKTGQPIGVEALLRWPHPNKGMIVPDRFIPLAEQAGLIHSITLWVLPEAVKQIQLWRRGGLNVGVAVNISASDLQDFTFPDFVLQVCRSTGTPLDALTLELTESAVMADAAKTETAFQRLQKMGVRLSIDDFGTGYSSFSYLQKLPLTEIKIDKSFVTCLRQDDRSAAIVRSIVDLGKHLRLSVVAEGVEDEQTWDSLAVLRSDTAQGYYICRPLPADDVFRWLNNPERLSLPTRPSNLHTGTGVLDQER